MQIQLKVASAQMVLNFASFLEENKYFEDAFRVYEKVRTYRQQRGPPPRATPASCVSCASCVQNCY